MNNRLHNCSFVKTILLLLVILYHSCVFWTETWLEFSPIYSSIGLGILAKWLNSFHVYAFVLVSGYIFAYKVINKEYQIFRPFFISKVKRLLIPYMFAMAIWVAPISEHIFRWNKYELFSKYILCINPSQLWFLWMLFWCFLIAWPLKNILLFRPFLGWLLVALMYLIGRIGYKLLPNYFCVWTAFQFVMFFYVGIRIKAVEESDSKKMPMNISPHIWVVVDILLFCIYYRIAGFNERAWKFSASFLVIVLHFVGAVMAWKVLQVIANKISLWKKGILFLSYYEMPIYLFHQQFIYFTTFLLNGRINPWLNAGINYIVATVGSLCIGIVLMHLKITKVLIGEKIEENRSG